MKGEGNPNFGKKPSAETRAKMSAASKGKPKSAEHRANISRGKKGKPGTATRGMTGKHHTEETKAKISASSKGKPKPRSQEHIAKLAAARRGKPFPISTFAPERAQLASVRTEDDLYVVNLALTHSLTQQLDDLLEVT